MRDVVTIGQWWRRKRDRAAVRIVQVHRADRCVEATVWEREGVQRQTIWFSDLRKKYELETGGRDEHLRVV